jgi:hypothetical protein
MTLSHDFVFLLDVDSTLLDNNQFEGNCRRRSDQAFGFGQRGAATLPPDDHTSSS